MWPGRAVKACCVTASAAHPARRVFLSSGRFARAPPHPTSPRPQPQGRAAGILITDTNKDRKWPAGRPIGRRPRPGWRRGRPACSGARAQALVALGRGKTADVSVVAVLGGARPLGVAGPGPGGWGVEGSHLSRPWSPQGGRGVCCPPRVCAFVSRLWGLLARRGPRPWVCSS